MRLSSRETLSHHKHLALVTPSQLAESLPLAPSDAALESKFLSSPIKLEKENQDLNSAQPQLAGKPHEIIPPKTFPEEYPRTIRNPPKNIVVYKQGISDSQEYSHLPAAQSKIPLQKPHIIESNFQPLYDIAQIDLNQSMLKFDKLSNILNSFGEYPDKYRTLIWRFLLSLPLNKTALESYLKRGIHPAFKNLDQRFSVKSTHLYNKLLRILSALAHWCPIFAEVSYLPHIVFPFVQKIQNDDLVLFEVLVSFFMQHC